MLSEVLGEHIPPVFEDKPPDYIDYKTYIRHYTKNKLLDKDAGETEARQNFIAYKNKK